MIAAEPPATTPLASLDRRTLLKGGLLGAGLASAAPLAAQSAQGFTQGVASGEPGPDRVLLWTRYAGAQDTRLTVELSGTIDFTRPVAGASVTAASTRDWCCKVVVDGLAPDRWYYYRFVAPDGATSPIGRTRTLPQGPTTRWRMAVFSCSNIGFGWFNAYAHAAAADEFDVVVHTGDYFYEYGAGTYPSREQALTGRGLDPADETISLADYRLRHATYRRDPDLQRLHQLYPMIAGWDDHESANDSWRGGAENHQPDTEGAWVVRKRAAMRAYREWMPVSDDRWATYQVGDLATLFRLETRLTGRDEAPSLRAVLAGSQSPDEALASLARFRDGDYADPARQMLGTGQERWVADGMRASKAGKTRWQVLVQQVLMGSLSTPVALAEALTDEVPDYIRRRVREGALASRAGIPLNMDAWDGYPAARTRLFESVLAADADLVVLAGDSHNAWAFDLNHDGENVGVEFAGHSVTSPGFEGYLSQFAPQRLARSLVEGNDQLRWADTSRRGYMAVELTPDRAVSEYRFMSGIRSRSTTLSGTHRESVAIGQRKLDG